MYHLRPYQEECLEKIRHVQDGMKALVMSSVGSGKTVIFASLAATCTGRVLIVTPSTELRTQAEEKLKEIDPTLNVGSVQANLDDVDAKIICSTRQSLTHPKSKRLKQMLKHGGFEYLIVDECHQAPKQIEKILKNLNQDIKTIGFTATPYTKECIDIFGQPIFKKSILDMIESDYLVEPFATMVMSQTNISHVKTTNGDFAQGELEDAVNNVERNNLIIESYKKYANNRKLTLVFAAGCKHGKELLRKFLENEIASAYIDGETSKETRKSIIESFKEQKIKVLINVMALATGFDVPATDCVILCRPTKSRILYEQIIGRGLRLAEGKDSCQIIDIQDVTKRHDLMNLNTIFGIKMKSGERLKAAKKRIEEEEIAEQKRLEEEERLRLEEEERKKKEKLKVHAEHFNLFNTELMKVCKNDQYDWWKVDQTTIALTYKDKKHYVIEKTNGKHQLYQICTQQDNNSISLLTEKIKLEDSLNEVNKLIQSLSSQFIERESPFKFKNASDRQKEICLSKYSTIVHTHWDVQKCFDGSTIKNILRRKYLMLKAI